MDVERIIGAVKQIILRHTKPERIWLYGSRATGEAAPASDIDIAYDDKEFREPWLIEEEVEKLPTLLKIDVKNIAQTEERFRQRIFATGGSFTVQTRNSALKTDSTLPSSTRSVLRSP